MRLLSLLKDTLKRQPEYKAIKKLDAYNGKELPPELAAKIEQIRKASDEALEKLKALGNDIILKRAEKELEVLEKWERDVGKLENAGRK